MFNTLRFHTYDNNYRIEIVRPSSKNFQISYQRLKTESFRESESGSRSERRKRVWLLEVKYLLDRNFLSL